MNPGQATQCAAQLNFSQKAGLVPRGFLRVRRRGQRCPAAEL